MGDSPKTLEDVKALLEQAVQVVSDLQASPSPAAPDAEDQAVSADEAQLAKDVAADEAADASEAPETDSPAPTA